MADASTIWTRQIAMAQGQMKAAIDELLGDFRKILEDTTAEQHLVARAGAEGSGAAASVSPARQVETTFF